MVSIPTPLPAKIGYNTSLNTTFFIPLSNNLSIAQPTGQQVQVQSTLSTDSSTGVGVQKVLITYLDTSWTLNTEIVTMNATDGTIPVLTTAMNISRIEDFEAFKVGSMGAAQGIITLTKVGDTGTKFAQIDIGFTKFLRAVHFVRPGHVAIMADITANCPNPSPGGAFFSAFVTNDNSPIGGSQIGIPENAFILAANVIHIPLTSPVLISTTFPIVCDARSSSEAIMMGIAAKGLAAAQTAIASFHYLEV